MDKIRRKVREIYQFCCGYCGVSEEDTGAFLTIDHHRPRSREGSEELENLVYCCTKCNQYKGSYWYETDPPYIPLLHPQRDAKSKHLGEKDNGELFGKTKEGSFLIKRLHLNRPGLIAYRQKKREQNRLQNELSAAKRREKVLLQRIKELDDALQTVTAQIQKEVE